MFIFGLKLKNYLDKIGILEYNSLVRKKRKKMKAKKEYKPRVIIRGNTGTRVMRSKKDKQNTRQAHKLQLKNYY